MRKSHLNLLLSGVTAFFLLSACSEETSVSQNDKPKETTEPVKITKTEERSTKTTTNNYEMSVSVMNEPVDFSTMENANKTFARIRSEEGDAALKDLKRALRFIRSNDPAAGLSTTATYAILNGKTPNEIINLAQQ